MDKSPLTYKRRGSDRPLSEIPWDASDVNVDPEAGVSLLASKDEGIGDVTPGKENVAPEKRRRKGWSDEPLPRKRTRSSTALETDLNLKDRASKLTGSISGKKDKDKGKAIERSPTPRKLSKDLDRATPLKPAKDIEGTTPRKQGKDAEKAARSPTPRKQTKDVDRATPRKAAKDIEGTTPRKQGKDVEKTTPGKHARKASPAGGRRVFLHSPIEFVKEKQAMFAEIDAFELESEEEDPEEGKGKVIEVESESPESNKGETSGQSPNTTPEQSKQETQKLTSTDEVEEKENG